NNYYGARNLTDGDTTTAWNEGASGDGIGETVTLSADTPQTVSGIRIMAGFDASQRTYNRNNRPRGITISYDGGQKQVELQDTYNEFQDIPLDAPASTTQITIRIDSVYKGNQYSDCCISEIEVY
ncbi:MAG: NADase-type glycan-binding domain-containing protein, partial [Coriobacteriales bacterium]